MEEIWKPIPGYATKYHVSSFGNVKSTVGKGRILKLTLSNKNYYQVNLYRNKIRKNWEVHKLVAIAFLGHTPSGYTEIVDHINNDSTNNKLANLQIISARTNTSKDKSKCSSKYTGVTWDKNANKWKAAIYIQGKHTHIGLFNTEKEASKAYQEQLKKLQYV